MIVRYGIQKLVQIQGEQFHTADEPGSIEGRYFTQARVLLDEVSSRRVDQELARMRTGKVMKLRGV